MIVSPDDASEIACLMVLQALVGDLQLWLSLPFTPFTYHMVLARAIGPRVKNEATSSTLVSSLSFTISSFCHAADIYRPVESHPPVESGSRATKIRCSTLRKIGSVRNQHQSSSFHGRILVQVVCG